MQRRSDAETVRRRIPEFGIRMALGATGSEVEALVEGLLYETPVHDRLAFTLAPALLLAVTMLAGWLPARTASRADPVRSLKGD